MLAIRLPYLSRVKRHDKTIKPHGRLGWVWLIQHRQDTCPFYVDLSCMSRAK